MFKPPFVVEATARLGYPESTIVGIGIVLLCCTVLYVVRRTAVLGAILLTGYLGGAVASNVRAGTPFFNVVFPVLFAVMVWASLVLRDARIESVLFKGRVDKERPMSFQAYVDNIKAKTGKTPQEFKKLAAKEGLLQPGVKAMAIVAWLKRDFGLGHGHAMAIYATFKGRTK